MWKHKKGILAFIMCSGKQQDSDISSFPVSPSLFHSLS